MPSLRSSFLKIKQHFRQAGLSPLYFDLSWQPFPEINCFIIKSNAGDHVCVAVQARSLWHRVSVLGLTCARMIVRSYAARRTIDVCSGRLTRVRDCSQLQKTLALAGGAARGGARVPLPPASHVRNKDHQTCQLALRGRFDSLFAINDWPVILEPACPVD